MSGHQTGVGLKPPESYDISGRRGGHTRARLHVWRRVRRPSEWWQVRRRHEAQTTRKVHPAPQEEVGVLWGVQSTGGKTLRKSPVLIKTGSLGSVNRTAISGPHNFPPSHNFSLSVQG